MQDISWNFSPAGWFKLNVDVASKGNPSLAGCGGLVRDEAGHWVAGFGCNIGFCISFTAKLWGVVKGMQMAWEFGI